MLAGLLNIPHQDEDWKWFAWQHRLSHDRIRQAIKAKYEQTTKYFRKWATAVDKKPDDFPYRTVVSAREFLEQEAKKKEKKP